MSTTLIRDLHNAYKYNNLPKSNFLYGGVLQITRILVTTQREIVLECYLNISLVFLQTPQKRDG